MADASWATDQATRKSMQANRSRDTKPELLLRRALHAMGLRYRVCARPLPDVRRTVDIAFPRLKIAVEVRGCFWHGCPEHYRAPSANGGYWAAKVRRNMDRDADTARRLEEAGWSLEVVWEHDDLTVAARAIAEHVRLRKAGLR